MASNNYQEGYYKYCSREIGNLTKESTDDDVREAYKHLAPSYEKKLSMAGCAFHKPMAERLASAIKEHFPGKQSSEIKIIDVAAGTGLIGVELQKLGFTNVDALDISQEMLDEAKKKNVYKKFICAAVTDQQIIEIETGEYDALICAGSIANAHIRCEAFVEMIRMVRTGGLLCFNIREDWMNAYQDKLMELEEAGKWEMICKENIPFFDNDELPRNSFSFVYKVLGTD